jgi:hypothetical protein
VTVTEVGDLVVDAGGSKASGFKKIKEVIRPLNPESAVEIRNVWIQKDQGDYQTFVPKTLNPSP